VVVAGVCSGFPLMKSQVALNGSVGVRVLDEGPPPPHSFSSSSKTSSSHISLPTPVKIVIDDAFVMFLKGPGSH